MGNVSGSKYPITIQAWPAGRRFAPPRRRQSRRRRQSAVNRTRTDNGRTMADACRRIPKAGDTAVRRPVRGDYTRFHWSLSVVVKRGPRAAIGATRDEF